MRCQFILTTISCPWIRLIYQQQNTAPIFPVFNESPIIFNDAWIERTGSVTKKLPGISSWQAKAHCRLERKAGTPYISQVALLSSQKANQVNDLRLPTSSPLQNRCTENKYRAVTTGNNIQWRIIPFHYTQNYRIIIIITPFTIFFHLCIYACVLYMHSFNPLSDTYLLSSMDIQGLHIYICHMARSVYICVK